MAVRFEHHFSLFAGPPGCSVTKRDVACRGDALPVRRFETRVLKLAGYIGTLEHAAVEGSCVRLTVRLAVDHSGPEGRICLQPTARTDIVVTMFAD